MLVIVLQIMYYKILSTHCQMHVEELIVFCCIFRQPILVMGKSPGQTSQTVQALVSCICPLQFAADYRPFFTIHDTEFKDVSRASVARSVPSLYAQVYGMEQCSVQCLACLFSLYP